MFFNYTFVLFRLTNASLLEMLSRFPHSIRCWFSSETQKSRAVFSLLLNIVCSKKKLQKMLSSIARVCLLLRGGWHAFVDAHPSCVRTRCVLFRGSHKTTDMFVLLGETHQFHFGSNNNIVVF